MRRCGNGFQASGRCRDGAVIGDAIVGFRRNPYETGRQLERHAGLLELFAECRGKVDDRGHLGVSLKVHLRIHLRSRSATTDRCCGGRIWKRRSSDWTRRFGPALNQQSALPGSRAVALEQHQDAVPIVIKRNLALCVLVTNVEVAIPGQ